MVAFLHTESTDLQVVPRLLSVAIVTGGMFADDFYAEVADDERLRGASAFASRTVRPPFGNVDDAACSYSDLGTRLWAFFDRQIDALSPFETLEVAFEDDRDWFLTRLAMKDASRTCWKQLEGRLRPRNVLSMPGFHANETASKHRFAAQESGRPARHRALWDARALRIDYEAANVRSRPSVHACTGILARSADSALPTAGPSVRNATRTARARDAGTEPGSTGDPT